MFKFIYNILLVTLLSGCLLLLDFSAKGIALQSALAQANSKEVLVTGGGQSNEMMASLQMIVVGLVASRLFKCKMTTDMMIAAGGGAIFIAGEIMSTMGHENDLKEMQTEISRDTKGNVDQKQIETLEKLKQSYVAAKKSANTKKMLQMATAATFLVAAGVAVASYMSERAVISTCSAGLTGASASCLAAFSASCASGGACIYPLQSGGLKAQMSVAPVVAADAAAATHAPSMGQQTAGKASDASNNAIITAAAGQCSMAAPAAAACKAVMTMNMVTKGFCPVPPVVVNSKVLENKTYEKFVAPIKAKGMMAFFEKYIISSAHGFSMIGITATAAVVFIVMMAKSIGTMVDMFLYSPMNRAIVWGVLAGISFMASSATGSEIAKIDSDIAKIDAILKTLYALENGVATANNTSVRNAAMNNSYNMNSSVKTNQSLNGDLKNSDIDLNANGENGTLPCITGESPTNCPSYSEKLLAQPDLKSMPDFVQSQISLVAKTTDGINGKGRVSAAALDNAQALAQQHNALKTNLKKQRKTMQDSLKASGSKIDLDNEASKFEASFAATISKGLKDKKMSANDMYASFDMGSKSKSDSSKNSKNQDLIYPNNEGSNAGDFGSSGSSGSGMGQAIDKAGKQDATEEVAPIANNKGSIDDYDLKNQISNDKDKSLFEVISNRYRHSYEKLFKRVK